MKLYQFTSTLLIFLFTASAYANPVKEKFTAAMVAFQNGDHETAVILYQETLKMYPDLAQAYNFMAMAKKELGASLDEIISLLKKAVKLEPAMAMAHDNLGKIYYSSGKFDLAKEHAKKAVELDPNMVTARLSLAWIYLMGFGETRDAIEHFEASILLQKTDYALFGLGMAYFMDHQRGKVLDMITQLKLEGNINLAKDLEDVIREGKYLPSKGVKNLLAKQAERQNKALKKVQEKAPIPNIKYPVRLSGQLQPSDPYASSYSQANPLNQQGSAATRRILQLQRNYR